MKDTKIIVCENYYNLDISKVEKKYSVKYIGDFCIKDKNGNWTDFPVSCFYSENPDISKGHSHYLGVFRDDFPNIILCNAETAFSEDFTGILYEDKIYISCYRHHFVSPSEGIFIDGGKDYLRCSSNTTLVKVEINKEKLQIIPQRV